MEICEMIIFLFVAVGYLISEAASARRKAEQKRRQAQAQKERQEALQAALAAGWLRWVGPDRDGFYDEEEDYDESGSSSADEEETPEELILREQIRRYWFYRIYINPPPWAQFPNETDCPWENH